MTAAAVWQFVFRRVAFYVSVATLIAHYVIEVDYLLTRWLAWHWFSHAIYFALPLHKASVFVGQFNPASVEFHLLHGVSLGLACVSVLVFFLVQFDLAVDFNQRQFPADFSAVGSAFVNAHAYFVPALLHLIDLWLNCKPLRLHHNKDRASWIGAPALLVVRIMWIYASPVLLLLALELLDERYFAISTVYGFARDDSNLLLILSILGVVLFATVAFVAVLVRPSHRSRGLGGAPSEKDSLLGGGGSRYDFLDSDREYSADHDDENAAGARRSLDDAHETAASTGAALSRLNSTSPAPVATAPPATVRRSQALLPAPVFPPERAADVPRLLAHEPTRVAVSMARLVNDLSTIDDMSALLLSEDRSSFTLWCNALIHVECRAGNDPKSMFREHSRAGRAVQEFVRLSKPVEFAKPIVAAIRHYAAAHAFPPVAPANVGAGEVQRLKELIEAVMGGVVLAMKKMPAQILDFAHELETAALAQFDGAAAMRIVGSFAFVHVFNPVITEPNQFGLEPQVIPASNKANASAALRLVANALLLLACGDDETIRGDPVLRRLRSTFAEQKNSMALVLQTIAAGAPAQLHNQPPMRVAMDRLAGAMDNVYQFAMSNRASLEAAK
jgi:hypothetical protein